MRNKTGVSDFPYIHMVRLKLEQDCYAVNRGGPDRIVGAQPE
jgi:hypothetical protein